MHTPRRWRYSLRSYNGVQHFNRRLFAITVINTKKKLAARCVPYSRAIASVNKLVSEGMCLLLNILPSLAQLLISKLIKSSANAHSECRPIDFALSLMRYGSATDCQPVYLRLMRTSTYSMNRLARRLSFHTYSTCHIRLPSDNYVLARGLVMAIYLSLISPSESDRSICLAPTPLENN